MEDTDAVTAGREGVAAGEAGERVAALLKDAEVAATAVRRDAEQQAQMKRRAAEAEVLRYTEEKRREADELLAERLRRISEVSDGLVERAEAIVGQLDEAEELKRRMQALVAALGAAAEELAGEMDRPGARPLSVVPDEPAAKPKAKPKAAKPRSKQPAAEAAPAEEAEVSALERLKEAAADTDASDPPRPERRGRFARDSEGEPAPVEDRMLGARLVALQMAVAGSDRSEVDKHLRAEFALDDASQILDEVFGQTGLKR